MQMAVAQEARHRCLLHGGLLPPLLSLLLLLLLLLLLPLPPGPWVWGSHPWHPMPLVPLCPGQTWGSSSAPVAAVALLEVPRHCSSCRRTWRLPHMAGMA